jgi:hypothetical protein
MNFTVKTENMVHQAEMAEGLAVVVKVAIVDKELLLPIKIE